MRCAAESVASSYARYATSAFPLRRHAYRCEFIASHAPPATAVDSRTCSAAPRRAAAPATFAHAVYLLAAPHVAWTHSLQKTQLFHAVEWSKKLHSDEPSHAAWQSDGDAAPGG